MQQQTEVRPRLLKVTEVAAELGVRPAFVYDLARRNLLPVVRDGRYCRFGPTALARWKEAGGSLVHHPEMAIDSNPACARRRRRSLHREAGI
jgi:excisionase family DNA binding protein